MCPRRPLRRGGRRPASESSADRRKARSGRGFPCTARPSARRRFGVAERNPPVDPQDLPPRLVLKRRAAGFPVRKFDHRGEPGGFRNETLRMRKDKFPVIRGGGSRPSYRRSGPPGSRSRPASGDSRRRSSRAGRGAHPMPRDRSTSGSWYGCSSSIPPPRPFDGVRGEGERRAPANPRSGMSGASSRRISRTAS